jgi:hypothetical protein
VQKESVWGPAENPAVQSYGFAAIAARHYADMLKHMRTALLLALLWTPVFGAAVSGVVKDPSGAAIAQAAVTLGERSTITNAQGGFEFPDIAAGDYPLTVISDGFELFSRSITAPSAPLTITLKLASLTTNVEVTGHRSTLRNSDPNYLALRGGALRSVYRVENLVTRDAATFTFRSGAFSFLPPVLGRVTADVFVGEGNFRLKPATEIAANHLRQMSGASTVDENFDSLVIHFTDATFQEITERSEKLDQSLKRSKLLSAVCRKRSAIATIFRRLTWNA